MTRPQLALGARLHCMVRLQTAAIQQHYLLVSLSNMVELK